MAQEGTALTIRFTPEMQKQVSEVRDRMVRDAAWSNPTFTDAVRWLISLGIERERMLRPPSQLRSRRKKG